MRLPRILNQCHPIPGFVYEQASFAEDAQTILRRCPQVDGFYGASSMERLPTERALTETTRRFMQLTR